MEDVDPLDYIENYNFSKRDFLLQIFKEYGKLPIIKSLNCFAHVFNDMFIRETP